jgi:uncharacterized protein (DUF433 family)
MTKCATSGKSRARAQEIAHRVEEGGSPSDLAVRFGLSLERVREILCQSRIVRSQLRLKLLMGEVST